MLDPFRPEDPKDVERLKALQRQIHEVFIDLVRERRGASFRRTIRDLFSGAFWVGREALDLGLVDGLGDIRTILRERFGDKVETPPDRAGAPAPCSGASGPARRRPESLIDPSEILGARRRALRCGRGSGCRQA